MLADSSNPIQTGSLDHDIQEPWTVKLELAAFIAETLPGWRDHPDRPKNTLGETILTEHLCDHLGHATYYSTKWSHIQFRTETADEAKGGRKIDLTIKPRGKAIIIEGRRHSQFDPLFPIECKRLPTPKEKDRDEREYVITSQGTTGGIQRFKFGHHGSTHNFVMMIAYVQEHGFPHWLKQINEWIANLAKASGLPWNKSDSLHLLNEDSAAGICVLDSQHLRANKLADFQIRHLWINMQQDYHSQSVEEILL